MKIVLITNYTYEIPNLRGDMIKAFKDKGHKVTLFGPESQDKIKDIIGEFGLGYKKIIMKRNGKNPFVDIISIFSIIFNLRKIKPDIVLSYALKPVIYGSIAAKIVKIKSVYSMISGLGSIIRVDTEKRNLLKKIVLKQLKISLKYCKRVLFHNKDDMKELIEMNIVKKDKCFVINGSGVNMEKFIPTNLNTNMTFLFIGRIIKDKGILEYIEAANIVKEEYPEAKFLVVGPYDSNPTSLEKKVINESINKGIVDYLGFKKDVRPCLEESTVFVLPSYHEGTPKSVLEAMASGRPIITSDAPGCRETVIDGKNGFLVPIRDSKALAKKMIWMINNKGNLKEMGKNSLLICKSKYDVKLVNQKIMNIMNF